MLRSLRPSAISSNISQEPDGEGPGRRDCHEEVLIEGFSFEYALKGLPDGAEPHDEVGHHINKEKLPRLERDSLLNNYCCNKE